MDRYTDRYTTEIESPEDVHLGTYQVLKPLTVDEYEGLKELIAANGIEETLKVTSDFDVIDGHHRILAWQELLDEGRTLPNPVWALVMADLETEEEKIAKAYEFNGPRRHHSDTDKVRVARDMLTKFPYWSNSKIASLSGVSETAVRSHRKQLERLGKIEHQEKLLGTDGRWYTVEGFKGNGDKSTSKPFDVEQEKGFRQVVEEALTNDPDATARQVSERTGAATWFVAGVREQLEQDGVIPSTGPVIVPAQEAPPGALEVLEEAGITLAGPPSGRTHEEKVYAVLGQFRDRLHAMPSDPKKVARSIADRPMQVVATVDDFGELARWLTEFHQELQAILEEAKQSVS